jgi:hypothetical protein
MNWRNRLPRPAESYLPDHLIEILRMSPEEYRREMRAQGFGDDYIDRELADLARAREQGLVPGPAKPAPPAPPPDAGAFEFLLRRRKERQRRIDDPED